MQIKKKEPLKSQQVRLPSNVISAAIEIARRNRVKRSDVYRAAIEFFVSQYSTDSKLLEENKKNADTWG